MKTMIALVVLIALAMSGCPAKKPVAASPEQKMTDDCFPKSVAKEIKKGNLEIIPGSEEQLVNPFTGESFVCPELRVTEKGREAILKNIE